MIIMIDDYNKFIEENPTLKVIDKWKTHGIKFVEVKPKRTRKRKKP